MAASAEPIPEVDGVLDDKTPDVAPDVEATEELVDEVERFVRLWACADKVVPSPALATSNAADALRKTREEPFTLIVVIEPARALEYLPKGKA